MNPKVHFRVYSARYLSLSWARSIQSMPPHPTSWRFTLILSSHLCLGLTSGLFPSGFRTTTLYTPLLSPVSAKAPPILFFSIWSPEQYWSRSTKKKNRKKNSRKWHSVSAAGSVCILMWKVREVPHFGPLERPNVRCAENESSCCFVAKLGPKLHPRKWRYHLLAKPRCPATSLHAVSTRKTGMWPLSVI
jgi:hypothetical protein